MKRPALIIASLLLLVLICWAFPLFHIVPLERVEKEKAAAAFNAARFAQKFWDDQLMKSLDRATQADVLLAAIQSDASSARKQFSRSVGVSDSYTYFVSGGGRVTAMTEDEISLAVTPGATKTEIVLQTGLLFGNAVRDGTGLLNVNDYPNSQDFNDIAAELNKLVETQVLPGLRERAKIGDTIRFAGCIEVNDESTDLKPLKLVPVRADIQ